MNKLKIFGIVRHIVNTLGAGSAGAGVVGDSPEAIAIGAALTLVSYILSYFAPEKQG